MKPKSGSTEKMLAVIQHNPLTIPTSKEVDSADMKLVSIGRLCFRGDSRPPRDIFMDGFQARPVMTQRLYDALVEIHNKHLAIPTEQFYPEPFLADMEQIRAIIDTDLPKSIADEFHTLPAHNYEAWINRQLYWVRQNKMEILSEDEFKQMQTTTKSITSPFNSQQMVATSKRFKAALLFPISGDLSHQYQMEESYVYVVYVEKGFDVHMHGIVSSLLNSERSSESDLQKAFLRVNPRFSEEEATLHVKNMLAFQKVLNMPLKEAMLAYVEEIITPSILPEYVVAAIPVQREVKLFREEFCQGSYQLGSEIKINPECALPSETITKVKDFLQKELQINAQQVKRNPSGDKLIDPSEGFHKGMKRNP